MTGEGHNSAGGHLLAFVERVERLEEEIKAMNGDKAEIYKEMRAAGFDVKTVRKIVAARKVDTADREEQDALFDIYWDAISRVHVHAREEIIKSSSSVPESLQAETKADVGTPPPASATPFQAEYSNEGDGNEVTEHKTRTLEGGAPEMAAPPPSATGGDTHGKQTGGERVEVKRTPLRPYCLNPNLCASGGGRRHCHRCTVAAGLVEAA